MEHTGSRKVQHYRYTTVRLICGEDAGAGEMSEETPDQPNRVLTALASSGEAELDT